MNIKKFPLNFPVFYELAVKAHTNLTQEDCGEILLYYTDNPSDFDKATVSRYIKGSRGISSQTKIAFGFKDFSEYVEKIRKLELQDPSRIAKCLQWMLRSRLFDLDLEMEHMISAKAGQAESEYEIIALYYKYALLYGASKGTNGEPLILTDWDRTLLKCFYNQVVYESDFPLVDQQTKDNLYIRLCTRFEEDFPDRYSVLLLVFLYVSSTHTEAFDPTDIIDFSYTLKSIPDDLRQYVPFLDADFIESSLSFLVHHNVIDRTNQEEKSKFRGKQLFLSSKYSAIYLSEEQIINRLLLNCAEYISPPQRPALEIKDVQFDSDPT